MTNNNPTKPSKERDDLLYYACKKCGKEAFTCKHDPFNPKTSTEERFEDILVSVMSDETGDSECNLPTALEKIMKLHKAELEANDKQCEDKLKRVVSSTSSLAKRYYELHEINSAEYCKAIDSLLERKK